jgi:hypothetical protein
MNYIGNAFEAEIRITDGSYHFYQDTKEMTNRVLGFIENK